MSVLFDPRATVTRRDLPHGVPWRAFLSSRRGNTAVEFALLAPLFVFCTVGVVQVGLLLVGQSMLDNAVDIAARQVQTAPATKTVRRAEQVRDILCEQTAGLFACNRFAINMSPWLDPGRPSCTSSPCVGLQTDPYTVGLYSDLIRLEVQYTWTMVFPFSILFPSATPQGVTLSQLRVFRKELPG